MPEIIPGQGGEVRRKRVGIDLGTTYSAVSWYDALNQRVETIDLDSSNGDRVLRSVVYYPGPSQPTVVGDPAWNAKRAFPDRVIVGIKRAMGSAFKTQPIDGREYTPQEVSSEILKVLAEDAKMFLGEGVTDVVITVPAQFGDVEIAATQKAGELAGLNVIGILPEPHAAALAYSVEKVATITDRHILVYDLGGGTFDVTLIHAYMETGGAGNKLKIDTLCKEGNISRGGLDWDRVLSEIVRRKIQEKDGVDIMQDPMNPTLVLDNCERGKRVLSRLAQVSIIGDSSGRQADVTRAEFEEETSSFLLETKMQLEKVIEDAEKQFDVKPDQIEVMLCGGSSKMPMVREMVASVMGKPPLMHGNPELLVTIGAAYRAHMIDSTIIVITEGLDPDSPPVPVEIEATPTDKSTYAIGVETSRLDGRGGRGSYVTEVVPYRAEYGKLFHKDFATPEDHCAAILIKLYKRASEIPSNDIKDWTDLMSFTIGNLPAGLPKGKRVLVDLGYSPSGILEGSAKVETDTDTTGKPIYEEVTIVVDRGL